MAIDVSTLVTDIGFAVGAVGAVGLGCLLVLLAAKPSKWVRSALGYSPMASTAELREVAAANAATAAWDSGYMRRQFDASWSDAEKQAWREGVAAQHEDRRAGR